MQMKYNAFNSTQLEFDFHQTKEKEANVNWHEEMLKALNVEQGPAWPDRFGRSLREWFLKSGHKPISILSLFSGGGGLDIAFHDAGFRIIEMVEIEPKFSETLQANSRQGKLFDGASIRCIDIKDYEVPKDLTVDFIIGGPPCQTFSAAGRRAAGVKGTTDPRGTLFEQYVRILIDLKPRGFLFENVYGITGAEGGKPWMEIQKRFREAGYTLYWRVLDAADYGVPQHRERLFIVGLRDHDSEYLFPCPTHGPDSLTPRGFYSAGEAVSGADKSDTSSLNINGRWGHLISDIPPGLNYSFYTAEMGHPSPVFAWRSKFSDFMYKADPAVPVRTIKAQGGLYTGPFSWENRHFSVSEIKRLQTFPDDYEVVGSRQVCIHQIGNSVPPQIGRMMALSILHQIFEVELPFPMHYIDKNHELGFRTRKRNLTKIYATKAKSAISKLPKKNIKSNLIAAFPSEYFRYLTDKFELVEENLEGLFESKITYIEDDSTISLIVEPISTENVFDKLGYAINIYPSLGESWPIPISRVTLSASSLEPKLFTTLWKSFEEVVSKKYGIDDLVQLCNYYQYRPKFNCKMEISDIQGCQISQWTILSDVVRRVGVGDQLSEQSLADLWNVRKEEVVPALHFLRSVGYEVRSHNTNPQIKKGDFLIPYFFPTLTPRSIQLRKKL